MIRTSEQLLTAEQEALAGASELKGEGASVCLLTREGEREVVLGDAAGIVTEALDRRLRELARALPIEALVLETDAPDIPPQWLYTTASARAQGQAQGRNSPAELPRIGALLASLVGLDPDTLARQTCANARRVLAR